MYRVYFESRIFGRWKQVGDFDNLDSARGHVNFLMSAISKKSKIRFKIENMPSTEGLFQKSADCFATKSLINVASR